jgi:hypothetical protein
MVLSPDINTAKGKKAYENLTHHHWDTRPHRNPYFQHIDC